MKISLKNQRIIIGIFTIILFGIIAGVIVYNINMNDPKNPKSKNYAYKKRDQIEREASGASLNASQKKLLNLDDEVERVPEEDEEQYTELYKQFIELPEEEQEKSEAIPRKNEITWVNLDTIKKKEDESFKKYEETQKANANKKTEDNQKKENQEDNTKKDENVGLPQNYNLADHIKIQVEHQGSFGLCWDFASMKALETHLATKNLGDYDFSEIHVDYIESNLLYGSYREVHSGGNFGIFEDYLNISGVVLEKDAPYRDHGEEEYKKFIDIPSPITVTETVKFPSIHKFLSDDDSYSVRYTDEQIKEYRETVKKHIMSNGGLYCYIATPDPGTSFFNDSTSAEYCDLELSELPRGVHAVTIVGWDDNYSRDNFKTFKKPQKDGAYIAVNSWGTGYGNKGYYYISYEDRYVEEDLNGIISTSFDDAYNVDSIKNVAIKEYINDNLSTLIKEHDGKKYVTKASLADVYSLNLSGKGLTSIEGIEMFPNVYELDLSNNNISDATPICNLNNLSSLNLSSNNITNIDFLNNCHAENMYNLNLSNNKITDLSPLQNKIMLDGSNINLSGNVGITGYEKINNISALNISNCGITDIAKIDANIYYLGLAGNKGIKGFNNIPNTVWSLDISECDIKEFPNLEGLAISDLNISKNELTNLNGIDKMNNLFEIDISENPINDWSALKQIKGFDTVEEYVDYLEENENQDEEEYEDFYNNYDYYNYSFMLRANKCGIDDLSIFNDISKSFALEIRNNDITDFSALNNSNIVSLDISENKDIKVFPNLSELSILTASKCNISDLNNFPNYMNIRSIDLSYNNILNIDKLAEYIDLRELSLAGNKKISGKISNEDIVLLNLQDCNLQSNQIELLSKKITYYNLKNNSSLSIYDLIKDSTVDYASINVDTISYDDYIKIKQKNSYIYVYTDKAIEIPTYIYDDGSVDVSFNNELKNSLMKNNHNSLIIRNGKLRKNRYVIDIKDKNSNEILIDLPYGNDYSLITSKDVVPTITYIEDTEPVISSGQMVKTIELSKKTTTTTKQTTSTKVTTTSTTKKEEASQNTNTQVQDDSNNVQKNTSLVGTWKLQSATKDGAEVPLTEIFGTGIQYGGTLTLGEDGKYTKYIGITSDEDAQNNEGTYVVDNNSVTLTSQAGSTEGATYDNGTIAVNDNSGYTLIFVKE